MSGDVSEDPVLVTSASDGTIHVHELSVWFKGRKVAGPSGPRGKKSKSHGAERVTENFHSNVDGTAEVVGASNGPDRALPPAGTTAGLALRVDFRMCIGHSC
ncbi:unnamed protein product, partial [Choristocarpus tenellus]